MQARDLRVHVYVIYTYHTARNLRGCKFSRNYAMGLQQKFSNFARPSRARIMCRTSKFSTFKFSISPRKTRNFAPRENFPLYGTYPLTCCITTLLYIENIWRRDGKRRTVGDFGALNPVFHTVWPWVNIWRLRSLDIP